MGVRVWLPPVVADLPIDAVVASVAVAAVSVKTASSGAAQNRTAGPDATLLCASSGLPHGIAEMDWPALEQTIANCQAGQLCTGRRAAVFGAGAALRRADWLVVGEPPDDNEELLGAPFADQVGQLLDNMLKAVGVSRHRVDGGALAGAGSSVPARAAYVTNVVKCRPAAARNPQPQELAACEDYLRREVTLVQPKVILALGRFAAQALLQGNLPEVASVPLGKLRGRIYRFQGVPVIVSYHPSYLLRTPQDKARAWADLCLALELVGRPDQ
jgi:uracil-DNA glycosylase family 4